MMRGAPAPAGLAGGTVADVLRALTPSVGAALVTPAAWWHLLETGAALPLSSGGGIECHLDCPDRADLAVRYLGTELATAASLLGTVTGAAELGQRWRAAPPSPAGARMLWLEFDVQAGIAPVPSVFAGPGYPPAGKPACVPDVAEWTAMIDALWPAAPTEAAGRVSQLLRALPVEAWIGYLGVMRGRELRATVSGMTPGDVPRLLQRLRWPGDPGILAGVLDIARRLCARLTLGLELTGGTGARIGVELGLLGADGWPRLIDAVAGLLPLTDAAIAALLDWPGESAENADWPASLRRQAVRIVRRLNHLKFGFDGVAPAQVKAYLYYGLLA